MQGGQGLSDRALGLRLAETLATRLCHDLSGPLSGLTAALGETGADAGALPLAQEAATVLRLRLGLLRAAWGAPTALSADMLEEYAAGLPNAQRLRLVLAGKLRTATLPQAAGRLLLNALLLAAASLPRGGRIALEGDPARDIVLAIEGTGAAWPAGLGRLLAEPDAAWGSLDEAGRGPRLHAALTALLAHAAGVRARLLLGATGDAAAPLLFDFAAVAR